MTRRRRLPIVLAAAGAGAVVLATALTGASLASADDSVALAPIVAEWPTSSHVTGMKNEPLYTEHIDLRRDGDLFAVAIEVLGQGDAALGTQRSTVRVDPDGAVVWTEGCIKSAELCAGDTTLRGFLATAALIGLERQGRLPERATARELHGIAVVCVADAELHPDAAPATVRLDPCFDRTTGAVLGHYSPDSEAFVAATFAPGFSLDVP